MATAAPVIAPSHRPAQRTTTRTRFYFYLALACLAIAVGGFIPTYWLQLALGGFDGAPLLHIHGLAFTAWLLLLVGQNWRIAQGQLDHHRAWGLAGIALATLLLVLGIMTAVVGLEDRYARGFTDTARAFLIVPFASIGLFYAFFVAAIANIRRPDWHRRFIFVSTVPMLIPPLARLFQLAARGWAPGTRPGHFPPPTVNASLAPLSIACCIILAGMAHDWRTRRSVHPAWTIGLAVIVGVALLRNPVAHTAAWQAFADWTTRIA